MRVQDVQIGETIPEANFRNFDLYRSWAVETDDRYAVYLVEGETREADRYLATTWQTHQADGMPVQRSLMNAEYFDTVEAARVFSRETWERNGPDRP